MRLDGQVEGFDVRSDMAKIYTIMGVCPQVLCPRRVVARARCQLKLSSRLAHVLKRIKFTVSCLADMPVCAAA